MVDASDAHRDDGPVTKASPAERLLSFLCVAGVVVAFGLAGRVRAPSGADEWTDGVAGARLWVLVGLVPVVVAGIVSARLVTDPTRRTPSPRPGHDRRAGDGRR